MSDKIPVVIDLVTEVNNESGKETTNNQVNGTILTKENATYIRYKEEIEDTGSVRNVIKINEEEVTIIRNGAVGMRQSFLEGQTTEGFYDTQFGSMNMETFTRRVDYEWTTREGIGNMKLAYQLKLQGNDLGRVTLTFAIREDDGQ
ncbi:MAG TPA: DUF1934 domain-containing protein [Bacillales bacterium]|nr:DUF1934 domain-containing protein [Bacillales bacterium]